MCQWRLPGRSRLQYESMVLRIDSSSDIGVILREFTWSNSVLGGSENHAPSVPPFREPRYSNGLDTRKTIAVQRSLVQFIPSQAWFAGPVTTSSRLQINHGDLPASCRFGSHATDVNEHIDPHPHSNPGQPIACQTTGLGGGEDGSERPELGGSYLLIAAYAD